MTLRKAVVVASMCILLALAASPAFAGSAEIYKAKCAACHGADGSGQTPVGKSMKIRNLRSAEVQKQTDPDLQKIVTEGKSKMPAFKTKLSVADISSLVAYIRGMAKK
jgi:mono/diheme cytochrome c family protein